MIQHTNSTQHRPMVTMGSLLIGALWFNTPAISDRETRFRANVNTQPFVATFSAAPSTEPLWTVQEADATFTLSTRPKARHKLYQRLKEKVKWTLYSHQRYQEQHRLALHALKKELVAKGHIRRTHYDLRLAEDKISATVRYQF